MKETGFPAWLLGQHPLLLVGVIVAWIGLFVTVINLLSKEPARIVAFAVLLGHTLSASTWLLPRPFGVLQCVALLVLAWYLDRYIWQEPPAEGTSAA